MPALAGLERFADSLLTLPDAFDILALDGDDLR